jgi:hypothetical protein
MVVVVAVVVVVNDDDRSAHAQTPALDHAWPLQY